MTTEGDGVALTDLGGDPELTGICKPDLDTTH
jgi:hypothetical protein